MLEHAVDEIVWRDVACEELCFTQQLDVGDVRGFGAVDLELVPDHFDFVA